MPDPNTDSVADDGSTTVDDIVVTGQRNTAVADDRNFSLSTDGLGVSIPILKKGDVTLGTSFVTDPFNLNARGGAYAVYAPSSGIVGPLKSVTAEATRDLQGDSRYRVSGEIETPLGNFQVGVQDHNGSTGPYFGLAKRF